MDRTSTSKLIRPSKHLVRNPSGIENQAVGFNAKSAGPPGKQSLKAKFQLTANAESLVGKLSKDASFNQHISPKQTFLTQKSFATAPKSQPSVAKQQSLDSNSSPLAGLKASAPQSTQQILDSVKNALSLYDGEKFLFGATEITHCCIFHTKRASQFFLEIPAPKPVSTRKASHPSAKIGAGLCASCSVQLSAKNFRLVEIDVGDAEHESEPLPSRKELLDHFLAELDHSMKANTIAKTNLDAKRLAHQRLIAETTASAEAFFAGLK